MRKGERVVVHSSVQMRSPYHTMHPLPYRFPFEPGLDLFDPTI